MINNQEVVKEQDEQKIFANLIQYAEEYIKENAFDFLKLKSKKKYDTVRELIRDRYKSTHNIFDNQGNIIKDAKDKIIERLCIQLQNYQAMPKAINYYSHYENNNYIILTKVKEYIENKEPKLIDLYQKFRDSIHFDEDKKYSDLPKIIKEELKELKEQDNTRAYNSAWMRYSKGIIDSIKYLNNNNGYKWIVDTASEIQKYNICVCNVKNLKQDFYDHIYYLGETLTYDFFKELGCTNLLKPDVHIKYLFKYFELVERNTEPVVLKKFIKLCDDYNNCQDEKLTPYYIDKILWLCCTGRFYEDGIIVTNMTRNNFIKFIKQKK